MSYGSAQLRILLSDPSITGLLTNAVGIFYDLVADKEYSDGTEVGAEDTFINYYRIGPVNGGMNHLEVDYSINCRAALMADAEDLAQAVYDHINRNLEVDGYAFRVIIQQTIQPGTPTDVYNAPLEIHVWGKELV